MPEDDLINLTHQVESIETEFTDQTKYVKKLEERIAVLEQDVKTLVFLCHYIRDFSLVRPGKEGALESFNVAFSEPMRRYGVPYP